MEDKQTRAWIRIISGIVIFYGTEVLERNNNLILDIFTSEPIILRYFKGFHLANAGMAPEAYVLLQLLAIVFIAVGVVGILKK